MEMHGPVSLSLHDHLAARDSRGECRLELLHESVPAPNDGTRESNGLRVTPTAEDKRSVTQAPAGPPASTRASRIDARTVPGGRLEAASPSGAQLPCYTRTKPVPLPRNAAFLPWRPHQPPSITSDPPLPLEIAHNRHTLSPETPSPQSWQRRTFRGRPDIQLVPDPARPPRDAAGHLPSREEREHPRQVPQPLPGPRVRGGPQGPPARLQVRRPGS